MAKKTAIRKMKEGEVPSSAPVTAETERQDLAAASVAAETTTKEGETSDRLPYSPRTKDGQEAFLALGKSIPSWLWIARARALGHSLTESEVREVIAYDGPEIVCTAPSAASPGGSARQR